MSIRRHFAALAAVALAACASGPATQHAEWGVFGIDLAGMDTNIRPGDDFWAYVNGQWARSHAIPADRGVESQVTRLNDLAAAQVRDILAQWSAHPSHLTGDDRRVADLWTSVTNRTAIEARGLAPLRDEFNPVATAADHAALAAAMGVLATHYARTIFLGRIGHYFPAPFSLSIEQDDQQPNRYVVRLTQSGLGMPSRDFYERDDATSRRVQDAYRVHLARMLALIGAGDGDVSARAQAIYAFEAHIAHAHWPLERSLDAQASYNRMSLQQLEHAAPGFAWREFFSAAGLADRPYFVVAQPSAFTDIAQIYADTPLGVLKDWLSVRLAKDRADVLPAALLAEEFAFSSGVLKGARATPAPWLRAVEVATTAMPDAVSRPYVERHFTIATRQAVESIAANVVAAMDRHSALADWLEPETRARARAKLASFRVEVGYPTRWRRYDGLEIDPNQAYANVMRAGAFAFASRRARIDAPVDRDEWFLPPTIANATFSPANARLYFSAAYLQAPHFDPHADAAVNYGAIGFVIGHEISHHFDDYGARFDEQGRLNPWWSTAEIARFRQRTQTLATQYDGYEVAPGLHIDGQQTLSENIADNAGLAIAFDAYHAFLAGRTPAILGGLSGDQRFFIARAQINRALFTDEELRRGVLSGTYAPSRWRTWSVRNFDPWYAAFNVRASDRLYLAPEQRVHIW